MGHYQCQEKWTPLRWARTLSRMGRGGLYRVVALSAVLGAVPVQAQNAVFANLLQARYVHCAFYKAYEVDRDTGDNVMVEGRSDTLTHFQGIEGGRARQ